MIGRLIACLLLTGVAHPALSQTTQPAAPQDEASCLAGVRMNDARRAHIADWLRIDRFRAPPEANETEAAWTARQRAALACGQRRAWLAQDYDEDWRRALLALPEGRQRELWAEHRAEEARQRANPPRPDAGGASAPNALSTAWTTMQRRWRDEDAAKVAAAPTAPAAPPPPAQRRAACAQLDAQGRDRCLAPVWYVLNDRGCHRVDTVIGDARNRIRTPLDFKLDAQREGIEVVLRQMSGPGQMVEARMVGDSSALVFVPNFSSCVINFNVVLRLANGLERMDLEPQAPPAWVAALGGP